MIKHGAALPINIPSPKTIDSKDKEWQKLITGQISPVNLPNKSKTIIFGSSSKAPPVRTSTMGSDQVKLDSRKAFVSDDSTSKINVGRLSNEMNNKAQVVQSQSFSPTDRTKND